MAFDQEMNGEPRPTERVVKLWSLLIRHLFLILFMSGVGVGMGYLYFLRTPPVFQSKSSLFVRKESSTNQIPFQSMDTTSSNQRDQPHAVLIVSPLVVERALNRELSEERSIDGSHRRLRDLPCFRNLDNPVGYIIPRLSARSGSQIGSESPDIVQVSYRDSDKLACKAVLDAVIGSYQEFLGESHKSKSLEVLELIQNARNDLSARLEQLESEYTQFRQDTPLLFNGESKATNLHRDRLAEIETARAKLIIVITERRAELQTIEGALSRGGSREAISLMVQSFRSEQRGSEATIKSKASEIFELMLDEQLLLMDLGPDHPKVKALQKKIALTQDWNLSQMGEDEKPKKSHRNDFLATYIDSMRHEISSIESKLIELDELFESERYSAKSIAVYEAKNENFKKEHERTEVLYQLIMKRLDELNLLQDYGGYKTAIISPAAIGSYVEPNFNKCLLLGALMGAAVGFGLGYLSELNDTTFRSPEEVSEHLGLPIVGHTPIIERETSKSIGESKIDKTLITFHRPKSRLAESYRAIRTSLYFSTRGEQHKVIQVSSPNPGDGKTTLSANLAVSIAQSGKQVILIDADFRRPRIHDLFGLDETVGISSVISGEAELPDAIQSTEVENLRALPCGPRPNNPCELLTSRRFEELLEILREQYDFIIIDTPPLLAVTDPSAVAARVDGVILTIRLSKRTRRESANAAELLASLGANTIGVVVNGVDVKSGYGYGYGYGYRYGYGGYQYRYNDQYKYGSDSDHPYYGGEDRDASSSKNGRASIESSRHAKKDA